MQDDFTLLQPSLTRLQSVDVQDVELRIRNALLGFAKSKGSDVNDIVINIDETGLLTVIAEYPGDAKSPIDEQYGRGENFVRILNTILTSSPSPTADGWELVAGKTSQDQRIDLCALGDEDHTAVMSEFARSAEGELASPKPELFLVCTYQVEEFVSRMANYMRDPTPVSAIIVAHEQQQDAVIDAALLSGRHSLGNLPVAN